MFNKIMKSVKKGFTLVELLVVIGVLGVLAAGLVVVINPADKIAQANDAKVKNDMSQIASAGKRYSATSGNWPKVQGDFIPSELTILPVRPSTLYAAYSITYDGVNGATFVAGGQVLSTKEVAAATAAIGSACGAGGSFFKYASGTAAAPIDKLCYSCSATTNACP